MLFLPGRARLPPIDRDESRYMQATAQMLETRDFVDVRFQDQPRYLQPAGIYWLEALSVAAFSDPAAREPWAYRIPSLLGATAAVLLTGWIGATLFGAFAGYTFWFPKAFGFRLHEGLGKAAFWFWFTGFYTAFMPLYVLGFMGMTRRMQSYDVPEWRPWLWVASAGAGLVMIGIGLQVVQLFVRIRNRADLRDRTGDP